jgi:hypothetical protein
MRAGRQVWGLNELHECRMVAHAACTMGWQKTLERGSQGRLITGTNLPSVYEGMSLWRCLKSP